MVQQPRRGRILCWQLQRKSAEQRRRALVSAPARPPARLACGHAAMPLQRCLCTAAALQSLAKAVGEGLGAEAGPGEAGPTTTAAAGKSKPTPLIVFWTASTAAATACIENTTACGCREVGNEASKVDWSATRPLQRSSARHGL